MLYRYSPSKPQSYLMDILYYRLTYNYAIVYHPSSIFVLEKHF